MATVVIVAVAFMAMVQPDGLSIAGCSDDAGGEPCGFTCGSSLLEFAGGATCQCDSIATLTWKLCFHICGCRLYACNPATINWLPALYISLPDVCLPLLDIIPVMLSSA